MPLRLYYVDSVSPFLDEILQNLILPHFDFKLQDSFRIFCPDAPTVSDVETVLLEHPSSGNVLIGRSIATLEQFFQDLSETHPAPRPLAGSAALAKALRLALKQTGVYQNLDVATQRQYLAEFRRLRHLLRIRRFSDLASPAVPRTVLLWEKILREKWGLWTRDQAQAETCRIVEAGNLEKLRGLREIFFLGFTQVDGPLVEAVLSLHRGHPDITLHLFLPPPEVGIDAQGWLAPLYTSLEKAAESVLHYQKLSLPKIEGIAYPTPFHEAHSLGEYFNTSKEITLGFHGNGDSQYYLRELLNECIEPLLPHQPSMVNPSGVPISILQEAQGKNDGAEEIYFKKFFEELLPSFIQRRLDLARWGQGLPLLHLEKAFAVLSEKARWESYQEELRPRQEWLQELQEEFNEIVLEESSPWFHTLPLRHYSEPGLKRVEHLRLFELNEGIFPRKFGYSLVPALAADTLLQHEAYLKIKAILHQAAGSATFSFVEQDMEGRIQRPSPLWEIFIETSARPKTNVPILWPSGHHPYFVENRGRETARLHHPSGALDRGELGSLQLRSLLQETLREKPLSATYLDDYAKCPWKFFARKHLKLEEAAEWILEMEPKLKGRLSHTLLEKVYQNLMNDCFAQGSIPGEKEREAALASSLQSCLEEWKSSDDFQKLPERLRQEEIRRLLSRVRRFLHLESEAWQQSGIPLFPKKLEWRFGKAPYPEVNFPLKDGTQIPLAGAIDRIDYNAATKEYLLLDYKASATEDLARQLREGLSYQLFLYLFAVGQSLFPKGKSLGALYGDLKKIKKNQGMAQGVALKEFGLAKANNKSFLSEEDFTALQKKLSADLEELCQKILEGDYSLNPRECQGERCPYHEICRYDHQPRQ